MNATSLKRIGTIVIMPSKGCEGLKKRRGSPMQSSRREFGGHPMHYIQWGYGNFSPRARSYDHNFYVCYEGNKFIARKNVRNGGNYVNMEERFHKKKGNYEGYYGSFNYGGYNYRKGSQTLGTTSRPLSYNNLKLLLLRGTFGPYDYDAWEQKIESLFYSYYVIEEEKLLLSKCEKRRRMGAQPIKTWSLMKQSSRNRFGVGTMKDKDKVNQRLNSWSY
ncbi:hypothetical protein M9H77_03331 [Catharanthus roseus]|uniref:Uncharacterized protein n=1 Tax=Catharanthus roseus TaxID=4058 RepID=A0ACC0CAV2_CATRO|nr:hypothetical protein M9H77_03331 [Catharanthus roseus]